MNIDSAVVFVIDDEVDVRDSLSRLLRSAGWKVSAHATADDFLMHLPLENAGCILLDVNMPHITGPQLHELLREKGVEVPIIYLTGRSSISISVHAMKQGASDFLEKPIDADILLPAIEAAVASYRAKCTKRAHVDEIKQRFLSLSMREREVLKHVIAGRMNKQIASDLGIAEKTVKVHRGRVMTKMGVRAVAKLVHLCDEIGVEQILPAERQR